MNISIQDRLVEFLQSVTGQQEINGTTELINSGVLDSLTMMDLLVFVESEFQLRLDFQDITPELFENAGTIAELIVKRLPPLNRAG